MNKRAHILSDWQKVLLGYVALILFGSILLVLPVSTRQGVISYLDALFTSASAACVTGFALFDTYSHFTLFGQIVILFLIQVGGIGIMTILTLFIVAMKGKPGFYDNLTIMHASGGSRLSDSARLIYRIVAGTLIFEALGAALLAIRFCPQYGVGRGLWFAIFHSVSAFCNAGMDLMGVNSPFSSLSAYSNDPLVLITVSVLALIGGLGFVVWNDVLAKGFRFRKYQTHTQIVLCATLIFILAPALLFYLFERNNAFSGLNAGQKLLSSLFLSVSPRTAGFSIYSMRELSDSTTALTMSLMFIGGNTGSAAGGIKITTFVIIIFGTFAAYRGRKDLQIGRKRMPMILLLQSVCIFATYLISVAIATIIVLAAEPFSFAEVSFEVVSALSTTGLSLGITPHIGTVTKIVFIVLMFLGKVGVMTLLYSMASHKKNPDIRRPLDSIQIG